MSMDSKLFIEFDNINTQGEVNDIQNTLNQLESVQLHEIGLDTVRLSYDQHKVNELDIEQAIREAGGHVRSLQYQE